MDFLESETRIRERWKLPELPQSDSRVMQRPAPDRCNETPPKPPDPKELSIAFPEPRTGIDPSSKILRCSKRRTKPPGQSSKGVTALSTMGKAGNSTRPRCTAATGLRGRHHPDLRIALKHVGPPKTMPRHEAETLGPHPLHTGTILPQLVGINMSKLYVVRGHIL